jgi:hypothetical protein
VRGRIKEGGHLLGSLHGVGGGQRSGRGAVAREEEAVDPLARVREGGRGRGRSLVGWLGLLGCLGPKGRMGRLAVGLKVEGKNHFTIKIGFLNIPGLWKFVQGDLGGILIWGFFLNSSRLLKTFRKI